MALAFLVIAQNPVRFRPMIIASVIERFSYGTAVVILFLHRRMHSTDLWFGIVDLLLGVLFVAAFFKTGPSPQRR